MNVTTTGLPPKQLQIDRADSITPRKIKWLWPDRIPLGKTTTIAGEPGECKSLFAIYVAACVTKGCAFADALNPLPASEVLFISGEDEPESVLVPRLRAAGADLSKVHIVRSVLLNTMTGKAEREVCLDRDKEEIKDAIRQFPAIRLVVIDPVTNHLGAKSYLDEQEMRTLLRPLEAQGVANLVVAHMNKKLGLNAKQRVGGAGAFIGLVRAAWLFATDSADKTVHHMMPLKNNYAAAPGLSFTVEEVPVEIEGQPVPVARIKWLGVSRADANDLMNTPANVAQARTEAADFLRDFLSNGPRDAAAVFEGAAEAGIAKRTLMRAKAALHIESRKLGIQEGWEWALPGDEGPRMPTVPVEECQGGQRERVWQSC